MNNIGIGIMCFGDVSYFNSTKEKVTNLKDIGIDCYILTDEPEQFTTKTIHYSRHLKSYHDKIILVKEILKNHDICILIDADTIINDYSIINDLKNYKFKNGITYIDNLLSNKVNKEFIGEINLTAPDWDEYTKYVDKLLPTFTELEALLYLKRLGARNVSPMMNSDILNEIDMRSMVKGGFIGGAIVFVSGLGIYYFSKSE